MTIERDDIMSEYTEEKMPRNEVVQHFVEALEVMETDATIFVTVNSKDEAINTRVGFLNVTMRDLFACAYDVVEALGERVKETTDPDGTKPLSQVNSFILGASLLADLHRTKEKNNA